ncbi:MAG: hypothetical protein ACRCUS_10390 [Anaerovoracaceae bacterium]
MEKKFNVKILREQGAKFKKRRRNFLKSFLIIFACGYVFFLSSSLWLPNTYSNIRPSLPGLSVSANDREVTLSYWSYSEKENLMEVLLEISNASVDGINNYKWSLADKKKGPFKIETIIVKPDFVVLHAKPKKGFKEVSLKMDSLDDKSSWNTIKFYTTSSFVKKVPEITNKSEQGYRLLAAKEKITYCRYEILKKNKNITAENTVIKNAQAVISKLTKSEEFKTVDEKIETEDKIAAIKMELQSSEEKIKVFTEEKKALFEKIRLTEEYLKKISEK